VLSRWIGAVLLVAGCGLIGIGQSRRLCERVRVLRSLLIRLQRLKTEVCCLLTPLPEVLEILCGVKVDGTKLRNCSFLELWCRETERLGLPNPETEVLEELGIALSRGDEPERAFRAAAERLTALLHEAENEAERKCRLCSSLGICAGVLLVIVLI